MANEVYTSYYFVGKIPPEFKSLEVGDGPEQISKKLGVELEQERWYLDGNEFEIEDNKASISTWSAWYPYEEPWEKIAEKYGLKVTYYVENEVTYWFDTNDKDCAHYKIYYGYDSPDECYCGDYEWATTSTDVKKTVKQWNLEDYRVVEAINYHDWYNDDLLLEYVYTPEDVEEWDDE